MKACELTMSVTALANAMACQLSDDELDLAAAIFSQLGDTLATISVQRSLCERQKEEEQPISEDA